MRKPETIDGYTPAMLELMRSICLTIATVLGDLMDDIVVVGGLVPGLILPAAEDASYGTHVGTSDVDVALSVTLMDEEHVFLEVRRCQARRDALAPLGGRELPLHCEQSTGIFGGSLELIQLSQ